MAIVAATREDLVPTVRCLAAAFAQDPITGYLLQPGPDYPSRLTQFFTLLMQARMALQMPVIVARELDRILGGAMGYRTAVPAWPAELSEAWNRFEQAVSGFGDRAAAYDEIAERGKPPTPHYYLGVIGTAPGLQGRGIGTELLSSFCAQSASDPVSGGVYLETASPANVRFYQRAGFHVTAEGRLGGADLWCMFLPHERRATG